MRVYRIIEKILLNCINAVWCFFIAIHEKRNIQRKKYLYCTQKLTDEQKRKIDTFFVENYGKKVSYKWHRLYQSYTGKFDYRYLPEYIFTTKIELLSNKRLQVLPMENKALLLNFVRGMEGKVRIPQTYVMCVQGRYYDGKGNLVEQEEAINILKTLNNGSYQAICKKTVDTSSGRDVRLIDAKDGRDMIANESIESVIASMGKDFVVQERVLPHPAFSALYSGSINTLRVVSYQTETKYAVAPIIMRIGRNGYVDNAHAGGLFIGVTQDGKLLKEAFTEYQDRYAQHPVTKVKFEGYPLPCIPEIIQAAIQMHKNYPSMRLVSWDFTVDQDTNIVLIEANLHSQTVWFSQMAHGEAFFGEDTAEMLKLVSNKKK